MSRKERHNRKVRARILRSAGDAFRTHGFHSARIDEIMEGAGLTRGAFYAHFPSKAALLPPVLAEDDLFLRLLRRRSDAVPGALQLGLRHHVNRILDPAQFDRIRSAWNLPFLARDASLGDDDARLAHDALVSAILEEMARGQKVGPGHPAFRGTLSLTCGALSMAAASPTATARDAQLNGARVAALALLGSLPGSAGSRPREAPHSHAPSDRVALARRFEIETDLTAARTTGKPH